ncbi:MAG: hypothetical protein U9Q15_01885 [Patescibacteria group bacterium]|nr:hypothetical protein [Patescibacteria group bacterium]
MYKKETNIPLPEIQKDTIKVKWGDQFSPHTIYTCDLSSGYNYLHMWYLYKFIEDSFYKKQRFDQGVYFTENVSFFLYQDTIVISCPQEYDANEITDQYRDQFYKYFIRTILPFDIWRLDVYSRM